MSGITLVVEDQNWRSHRGIQTRVKQAADAARKAAKLKGGFTILLARRQEAARPQWRFSRQGQADQCPVFSVRLGGYAGDIAIAYGVTRREAKDADKNFADHASHLVVHGVLHLAGYDHERPKDAKLMEPLEVKILKRLGIADPYASPKEAPR